ncbi:hypothetical protein K2F40_15615 [Clostridium sp. CM028]|uniref:hypothetical protein n=1 Tax=Clostridium sp. CM028 TaxID=2851575 RepID=UPI001C6E8C36|nr:hypothetical protein [Clostridium sp. CM028]MBW9150387.1 hypothetical protein [Clostridium sp. CM028]WLC63561.1 hypothetical protein KTC94_17435 [Clostridium sp. CM028]
MGEPKKLELTIEKLIEIAIALNENTLANRNRSKEDKISTDKFIRRFDINRKRFSVTIQDTDIKYNKSTFRYDIPDEFIMKNKNEVLVTNSETCENTVNKPNTESETLVSLNDTGSKIEKDTKMKIKNEALVINNKARENIVNKLNNEGETFVSLSETALAHFDKRIKSIEEMKYEFEEMSSWYKKQRKKENIIDVEIPEIKIDKKRLNEEPSTRGFKVYPSVIAEFKKFSMVNRQYTMQDLMAMAMIEYINKYKR